MRERNYIQSFIEPADSHDYCWETFGLPRYRDYNHRATRNSDYNVPSLQNMPLKARYLWPENHKYKKWLLCSYDYSASVDWMRFDLDRHNYENVHTPDEFKDAEHDFYLDVQKLEEIADEQGFDLLWATSPGDIVNGGYCDGQHIQGLYAWIFFDRPVSVLQLVGLTKTFKEYHDLNSECSWDRAGSLIRLPGQRHVELVNPYNMKPKHEYDDSKPAAPLHQFNDAMYHVEPAKINELFGQPLKWQRDKNQVEEKATPIVSSPRKKRKANWDTSDEYVSSCRSNGDTWDRIWSKDHTAQLLALKYNGDLSRLDQAVSEFEGRVLSISPSGSETISFPANRRKFAERLVSYAFHSFDPNRTTSNKRRASDVERFSDCSQIDRDKFRWMVNGLLQVSEDDLSRVMRFFDYVQSHNGRVYYGVCHSIFGGKRNWERMQRLMRDKGILVTLDEFVRDDKCRQYGWSEVLVKEAKRIAAPSGLYSFPPIVSISCTPLPVRPVKALAMSYIQEGIQPKPLGWNTS